VGLRTFAEKYRLYTKLDIDGTTIIAGKLGHVYEHSETQLGLLFMPTAPRARLWSVTKTKGTAAGMVARQKADSEGTLLFDADSPEQARLAVSLVRARPKRILTEEQRSALSEPPGNARQRVTSGLPTTRPQPSFFASHNTVCGHAGRSATRQVSRIHFDTDKLRSRRKFMTNWAIPFALAGPQILDLYEES
jgi:hypothetical protein